MTEDDLFNVNGSDMSREFLGDRERGTDPFCARPWHTLKIHMDKKTRVCCDFFTWLPAFEFPTARDFHSEDGMWNHPFMQHMRGTMGLPGEVPFCTLCLTADKRDPAHADRRRTASAESRQLCEALEDERRQKQLRGNLSSAPDDLSGVVLSDRRGKTFSPFRTTRSAYRRKVARYGFFPRKRILFLECAAPGWAPFVAEGSESFVAADIDAERIGRAVDTCSFYGIEATEHLLNSGTALSGFEDGSFDGIWVDGRHLVAAKDPISLTELRRILSPDGTLHCRSIFGPGRLLQMLAREQREGRRNDLLEQLRAGPERRQAPQFMAPKSLRRMLNDHGLRLDVAKATYGARDTIASILGTSALAAEDITRFKELYEDAQGMIDTTLSFSARRR